MTNIVPGFPGRTFGDRTNRFKISELGKQNVALARGSMIFKTVHKIEHQLVQYFRCSLTQKVVKMKWKTWNYILIHLKLSKLSPPIDITKTKY